MKSNNLYHEPFFSVKNHVLHSVTVIIREVNPTRDADSPSPRQPHPAKRAV